VSESDQDQVREEPVGRDKDQEVIEGYGPPPRPPQPRSEEPDQEVREVNMAGPDPHRDTDYPGDDGDLTKSSDASGTVPGDD
jgi:hypothetical protein